MAIVKALPTVIINIILLKKILQIIISGTDLYKIFWWLGISFAIVVVIEGVNEILENYIYSMMRIKIHTKIQTDLFDKGTKLDMRGFDNSDFYNEVLSAVPRAEDIAYHSLNTMAGGLERVVQIVLISSVFLQINWIYLVYVLCGVIFTLALNPVLVKLNKKQQAELIPVRRKKNYFSNVFHSISTAKELRLFGGFDEVLGTYLGESYSQNKSILKKHVRIQWKISALQSAVCGLVLSSYLVLITLGYSILVTGTGSLSDFAPVYNGVNTIMAALFYLVGPFISVLLSQVVHIDNFKKFLALKPSLPCGTLTPNLNENLNISMNNVSFSYHENQKCVLNNLNIKIETGKKYAIVGENGAGKSTLLKLILRLYDPHMGVITLSDTAISEYILNDYRSLFSTVFQDILIIPASLGCNVSLDTDYNDEMANSALELSGFNNSVDNYELSRSLLRDFDNNGLLLSGGQWQRVALSRALYKNSPIIIMDEASSALDPQAEYNLNQVMQNTCKDKTIIFISHRLTTTKQADHIFYIKNGELTEQGTHKELLQKEGCYANMWKAQTKNYLGLG